MPVAIPGAKPRAILTMLGLHDGSVVPADALIKLLWGDDPPRTAAKALQTHISALRRALGDGLVVTEGAGWRLTGAEVDASRYKSAAKAGRDAAAVGDTGQAVARLEEALVLWRGVPELPDGQRGLSEKTRWIESNAALVEDRADAVLATGRAAEAIGDLEAAVAEAPLRERRWGQLMLALYRAGRQGEALGAYQRARSLLADELGVDPGPELRRLEAAIVAQDTSLDITVAQRLPSVTRAVTFLLTDIEGSTAAWESDADAMAMALARHDELVEQVVTSRGGRLIKTRGEGDATFSVFDRPSAAAAAAIELQDAITHEPWALRDPIRVRMALHTGEVELRDGDYFGRAVNRVARLRSLAEGGQILCSGATAELVIDSLADDVMLNDLGMRQLKNLARPEHVFELRLDTAVAQPEPETAEPPMERPDLPAVLVGPGPFVGRGHELDRLLEVWQTALAGGVPTVLIAGEPGVGKTRLAGEWSQRAYAQGAVVLYGRCDEDLGLPYQPFAEALRSLVPCMGADRLRGLRGVEALLPLAPGLTEIMPDLAPRAHPDPDTERYALFDAVVALLEIASKGAPVLLILDDLHWAAKPTLLLLRHLVRFGDHARVQIVGTYRSTDLDRSHPLAAMLADLHRDGTANRLSLGGLDAEDVTTYVAEAGYDDEELAHALASVTGGNPFFLIEALRHVDESGGVWDQSTLPQGVREAVSRRLSRLPVETNKALAAAAVVGSRFALGLVEQVVGSDLIDAFDEACQAGIVIEEPGGNYRFNHAIVRQSLLTELASVRRMRLHQRIAATLETLPGADDELLAELAHHYYECAWAGNAAKAVFYCRRAADQAMTRLAYEGAADLYRHALHSLEELDDELPDRDDQTAELLIARCEALLAAGDVTSAAGAVSQLRETTIDSPRLAAWATCFDGQLSMLIHPERLDDAEVALGAAAAKLAQLDDAAGEAKAHTVRAGCLARLGRIGDCEVALDDALTAARRAREHRRVNAVLAGAPLAALWGPNPVPRAGGRCLDVVRLLRITTDSPAVEATSTRCQAVLEAFRGRAAAARRMIDSARRTVIELGLRHARLEVEQFAGIVELVVGDPAAAEPHLRKAYNGFRRMGLDADTAETAALLGRACLALDRDAEADELCAESERLAGHALKASMGWRTLRAHLLSRGGDHDAARRVAEAAVGMAERTDALVDHGDACLTLAIVLAAAGNTAGARVAAEQAVGLYERKGAAALAEMARGIIAERVEATAELDTAHARFEDERQRVRRLENTATHVFDRFWAHYAARDWTALAETLAENVSGMDHRRVVNAGMRRGRDAVIDDLRVAADLFTISMVDVVAPRGERLALGRVRAAGRDPETVQNDAFNVIEIDADERITVVDIFDLDDVDAAFNDLDARYLTGEAAPYAHVWTLTLENYAALSRHELIPMAADAVTIDHRRAAAFAPGELLDYLSAAFDQSQSTNIHPMVVHRLTGLGAVITHTARVTSRDGFDAEFQDVVVSTLAGNTVNHLELFDEADLDAALVRFEQVSQRAPKLENAASRARDRFLACFIARDWDTIHSMLADDHYSDDRRRVIGAGIRRGRDAQISELRAVTDEFGTMNLSSIDIATRGERLVLSRHRYMGQDEGPGAYQIDVLQITEIGPDQRIAGFVMFDLDDIDAAFAELENRYLAGEAARHSATWSTVTGIYAGYNRHELPATTPDWVFTDHRSLVSTDTSDLPASVRAGWNLMRYVRIDIEAVHRLSNLGVVVTAHNTSRPDIDAEWRTVNIFMVDGGLMSRCEIFDEADLDAALARFDELQPRAGGLENAASQACDRYLERVVARDWVAMKEVLADDYYTDDRRHLVGGGSYGRDAEIVSAQAQASVGITNVSQTVLAVRGSRLALSRLRYSASDHELEAFVVEILIVVQTNSDGKCVATVAFDLEDIDAAFAEIDARYLAGEAAAYSDTWSAIVAAYAAINRGQLPPTTTNFEDTDHRRGAAMAPGELLAFLRSALDQTSGLTVRVAAVHRIGPQHAIVTHAAVGTSPDGFEAEWREICVLTTEGDMLRRCEVFDEADLDTAIARFDRRGLPTPHPENRVSQVIAQFMEFFAVHDWDAMADLLADDVAADDRRRVINAGMRRGRDAEIANWQAIAELWRTNTRSTVATRGEKLALFRFVFESKDQSPEGFSASALAIIGIDDGDRIAEIVVIEPDDFEAAFAELDARYLVGEAAPHAHAWSAIAGGYSAFNRRELPPMTPNCASADHRQGPAFEPDNFNAYVLAGWDLEQNMTYYIETVHRLSDLGGVVSGIGKSTSQGGFDAEWRTIAVLTFDGEMMSRCELFDETSLDAAIARFEELNQLAPRLENDATRALARITAAFNRRDMTGLLALTSADGRVEDRRKGLRDVLESQAWQKAIEAMFETLPSSWRMEHETIAVRGSRLSLSRELYRDTEEAGRPVVVETLRLIDLVSGDLLHDTVAFDPDDIGAAFAELDARYLAGEAAAESRTWSALVRVFDVLNRGELPTTTPTFKDVDHRLGAMLAPGDLMEYLRTSRAESVGSFSFYVEAVHRLSNRGAVVTHVAKSTSEEGFYAEWRMTDVFMVDGDLIDRYEFFDEADLDAALARFDELQR